MVDNDALARQLEAALLAVYGRAVAGEPPTSLRLDETLHLAPLPYGRQADGAIPGSDAESLATAAEQPGPAVNGERADRQEWSQQLERGSRSARLTNLGVLQHQVLGLPTAPLLLEVGRSDPGGCGHEQLVEQGLLRHCQASAERVLDGRRRSWHQYQAVDLNSHLPLRRDWLALFPGYGLWGSLTSRQEQETDTLLALLPAEAAPARMACLDLRGAELQALQAAPALLEDLALLQCRTAPTALYEGGSSLFDLGPWLQQQGFVLHRFCNENRRLFRPYGQDDNPFAGRHQLLQLDAVFMPDPLRWSELAEERLLALAFLAHALYRSSDVAMLALEQLDRRDRGQRVENFRRYLEVAGADA